MNDEPDKLIQWQDEAAAVIKDVQNHVKEIKISDVLESNAHRVYLNLTTMENRKICVCLSGQGFQIIGSNYDEISTNENSHNETYETLYSLLNSISEGYVKSFGNHLADALAKLLE